MSNLHLTESQVGMYNDDLELIFRDIKSQYFDNKEFECHNNIDHNLTTEANMEDITQFTNALCDSLIWFYKKVGEVK